MVLGNMDVGLNTQNLAAIVIVILLSVVNIFGVRTGAMVQNIFTVAKTAALLGLVLLGLLVGRNAQAIAANFGAEFWRNAGWHSLHPVEVGVGGPIALVGMLTILAVAQTGSLFSSDAWNNITFTAAEVKNPKRNLPLALAMGTGAVTLLVCAGQRRLPNRACRCMAMRMARRFWRAAFSTRPKTAWQPPSSSRSSAPAARPSWRAPS